MTSGQVYVLVMMLVAMFVETIDTSVDPLNPEERTFSPAGVLVIAILWPLWLFALVITAGTAKRH